MTLLDTSGAPVAKFGYSVSAKKFWRLCYETMQLAYIDGDDDATHHDWSAISESQKAYMKDRPFEPAAAKLLVAHNQRLNGEQDFNSMSQAEITFLCNQVRDDPSFLPFVDYMEKVHAVERNTFLELWGSLDSDQPLDLCDYQDFANANGIPWDPLEVLAARRGDATQAPTAPAVQVVAASVTQPIEVTDDAVAAAKAQGGGEFESPSRDMDVVEYPEGAPPEVVREMKQADDSVGRRPQRRGPASTQLKIQPPARTETKPVTEAPGAKHQAELQAQLSLAETTPVTEAPGAKHQAEPAETTPVTEAPGAKHQAQLSPAETTPVTEAPGAKHQAEPAETTPVTEAPGAKHLQAQLSPAETTPVTEAPGAKHQAEPAETTPVTEAPGAKHQAQLSPAETTPVTEAPGAKHQAEPAETTPVTEAPGAKHLQAQPSPAETTPVTEAPGAKHQAEPAETTPVTEAPGAKHLQAQLSPAETTPVTEAPGAKHQAELQAQLSQAETTPVTEAAGAKHQAELQAQLSQAETTPVTEAPGAKHQAELQAQLSLAETAPAHSPNEEAKGGNGPGEAPGGGPVQEAHTDPASLTDKDAEPAPKKPKVNIGYFSQFQVPMDKAPGLNKDAYEQHITDFFPDNDTQKETESETLSEKAKEKDKKDKTKGEPLSEKAKEKDKKDKTKEKDKKEDTRGKKKKAEDGFLLSYVVNSCQCAITLFFHLVGTHFRPAKYVF